MNTNLYASLAALAPLDSFEQDQALQLAEFSKMLTSFSTTNTTTTKPNVNLCSEVGDAIWTDMAKGTAPATSCQPGSNAIPFDSPLDQSLGSPASTRDFQESPLQDIEFDFGAPIDAPLFPDHGTQQHQNDNLLAGLPLFGGEFSFSQQAMENPIVGLKDSAPSSQASNDNRTSVNVGDFSFDAMARNMISEMGNGRLNILASSMLSPPASQDAHSHASSPSAQSAISNASMNSSQDQAGINQLAAVFVREYARTHPVNDIDVLLRALRVAGIDVSDEVVADILASASPARSPSPSIAASASPMSSQSSNNSPSVSPMALPQAVAKAANKTRSSAQSGSKTAALSADRNAKKFVCDTCKKTFDRAFNLRTHALTHVALEDREKPYTCPWGECHKPFMRKYDAERHYHSVHVKRGEVAKPKEIQKAFSGEHGIPAPSAIAALFSDADITQANG